ncbi:MAG: hypothetical protein CMM47_08155 [Rhodospirillaceae bacterium]|nr:hypothetical protein [Rhodospirillaceae bacterium]
MADDNRVLSWRELLSSKFRLATLTLALSIALYATNFFIFATLAPSVVNDIGGLDLMSWATTVFVVTSIVSSAAGGMIKAWLGSRRSLVLSTIVFALGSVITAASPTMEVVLLGRVVQGLGAGLLTAYSHSMVREMFPAASWPRMFAVVSGGWGVAALSGPLIGGIFAEFDIWRWGFGAMAIAACLFIPVSLRAVQPGGGGETGNAWGAVARLSLLGGAALILGGLGKVSLPGGDISLITVSVALLLTAILWERQTIRPLFPRDMFRPATALGGGVIFVFGITFATTPTAIYGPLLFRAIHDIPLITTGYIVTAQSMFWTIAAIVFSNLSRKASRFACIAGTMIVILGVLGTSQFLPRGPLWAAIAGISTIGFGIGLAWGHIGRFVLEAAGEQDKNRVGTVMPTMQVIGIAFGSSVAGLIANANGFDRTLTEGTAEAVAHWIYLGLAPAAVVSLVGAIRVATETRTPIGRSL